MPVDWIAWVVFKRYFTSGSLSFRSFGASLLVGIAGRLLRVGRIGRHAGLAVEVVEELLEVRIVSAIYCNISINYYIDAYLQYNS